MESHDLFVISDRIPLGERLFDNEFRFSCLGVHVQPNRRAFAASAATDQLVPEYFVFHLLWVHLAAQGRLLKGPNTEDAAVQLRIAKRLLNAQPFGNARSLWASLPPNIVRAS
jgi:hypothetical protein